MNGISGFKAPDTPILAPATTPADARGPESANLHELVIPPEKIPDATDLSPEEIYDVFSELVKEFGSEEAKADLAAGKNLELLIKAEGQDEPLFVVNLNSFDGTGWLSNVSGNNTISKGGSGQTQAPPCSSFFNGDLLLAGLPHPGEVPAHLAHLFEAAKDSSKE